MMGKRCQIKLFVVLDEKRRVSPRNGIISEGKKDQIILATILADFWVFRFFQRVPPSFVKEI